MTDQNSPHTQEPATKESIAPFPRDRMVFVWGILLSVVGFCLSLYATFHHLDLRANGATSAGCNINQTVNCDAVASSAYAEPFGLPMGLFGLGYFAGLAIMLLVGLRESKYRQDALIGYKYLGYLGGLISLGLLGLSVFQIGAVCLVCMGVYAVCFAQIGVSVVYRKEFGALAVSQKSLLNGVTYPAVSLMFVIIVFSFVKPESQENFTPDLPKLLSQAQNPAFHAAPSDGHDHSSGTLSNPSALNAPYHDIPITRSKYAGLGEDFRKGPDDAKVVIVEFADYQCPACRQASQVLRRLASEMGPAIQVVFRNYPLDNACNPMIGRKLHEWACDASILTRCAGRIGKFWQLHDRIFDNQSDLNGTNLEAWSKEVGLSDDQISECRASKDILAKIQDDIKVGDSAGVSGTPTIFINGKLAPSRELSQLREWIEIELAN